MYIMTQIQINITNENDKPIAHHVHDLTEEDIAKIDDMGALPQSIGSPNPPIQYLEEQEESHLENSNNM